MLTGPELSNPASTGNPYSPAWSPDGTTIAFVRTDFATPGNPSPAGEIWVMKPDGSGLRALGAEGFGPDWSPDSTRCWVGSTPGFGVSGCSSGRRRTSCVRPGHLSTEDTWRFEVTDNGDGVPLADADAVFLPFCTGSSSSPGNGLGLAKVSGMPVVMAELQDWTTGPVRAPHSGLRCRGEGTAGQRRPARPVPTGCRRLLSAQTGRPFQLSRPRRRCFNEPAVNQPAAATDAGCSNASGHSRDPVRWAMTARPSTPSR